MSRRKLYVLPVFGDRALREAGGAEKLQNRAATQSLIFYARTK